MKLSTMNNLIFSANKRCADGPDYQEPVQKLSRVPENPPFPLKNYEGNIAFIPCHDPQSTLCEKFEAVQGNADQLDSFPDDSHYTPAIEYQPSCTAGKQSICDNSLNWISSLPSFQDLVVSSNWIDRQCNEVIYQKDQKLFINDTFDNTSRFVSFF